MNYGIVKDLKDGKFYAGGKIFIRLKTNDKAKRAELFEIIKGFSKNSSVTKINLNIDEGKNENEFKSKLMNSFLDLSKNQNPASIENIEADAKMFLNQLLPDDLVIFIPSSGISSNELHCLESNCIIYLELTEKIKIGFVIDKIFLDILTFSK